MNPTDLLGSFTWMWCDKFFVETNAGNFVWSDPDYDGDNTLRPYDGSLMDYCWKSNIPYGRDKGKHYIKDYCGDEVKVVV